MSTILVTGAAGFLGHHISKELLIQGHIVIGIDNLIGGDFDRNIKPLKKYANFYFYKEDVVDFKIESLGGIQIDYIFHAACYPHEGLSVSSPKLIAGYSVGLLSMAVLSLACKLKIRRLINCSSMARYGFQETVPFTEDMIPNPVDPYGTFKYASERAMNQVCDVNDIEFINLVPHNIYGPNQKFDDPFRNVAAIMCNRVLQNKQPIIYGDGTQKRCFSYIGDIIHPMVKAIFDETLKSGITINIGPEEPFIEVNELAKIICEVGGIGFNPIYVSSRPCEVKHANCSNKLSKELLGAKYRTTLKDGIEELMNWIKSVGPREFRYHLEVEVKNKTTPITWIEGGMN